MQNTSDISSFTKLLHDYEQLGMTINSEPTYLEISKYPHYENVCSNILSFYVDPNKEHGLNNLLLSALLDCIGKANNMSNIFIEREVFTGVGRIDLVIDSDEVIIAIENKIFHNLQNDLNDYKKYITIRAKEKNNNTETIFLILSIHKVDCNKCSGFTNVTYSDFFESITKNIGKYVINSNNKYLIFLFEFIKSIENIIKGSVMNKELLDFFNDNLQTTNTFMNKVVAIKSDMRNKVNDLSSKILINEPTKIFKQGLYREQWQLNDTLFYDIKGDFIIAIDCRIYPVGWKIIVFERNIKSITQVKALLDEIGITYNIEEDRCKLDIEMPYDEPIESVANILSKILSKIIKKVSNQ